MNAYPAISAAILTSLVGLAAPALAQDPPPPPPPPAEAPPPPAAEPTPPAVAPPPPAAEPPPPAVALPPPAAEPPPEAPRQGEKDGVRLRGGLGVNGGIFLLPANPVGGAASLSLRIGVQFNHYLSLYYQNTPIIGATVAHQQQSATVVAVDDNSLLLGLTLFHVLDIGAGPSLDYLALAKGSISNTNNLLTANPTLATGTGVVAGAHGRIAFVIGGLNGEGPRRSGLTIGVDAHPMFLSTGQALSLTAGLGVEWY